MQKKAAVLASNLYFLAVNEYDLKERSFIYGYSTTTFRRTIQRTPM
jgi:hypothetical protein